MSGRTRQHLLVSCRKLIVPVLCSYLLFQLCYAVKRSRNVGLTEVGSQSSRNPKNLFPFVWVTFQPSPCGSDTPNAIKDGVCVQRGKCSKRGGTANSATCRDGFGECCTFTEMCNGTKNILDIDQLVTTINSPNPIDTECTLRFRKEPNICQIRLDFPDFVSEKANTDGICEVDRLRISNSITVPRDFTTCGTLTGQHMYLTFGSQDMIEVTPIMRSRTAKYKIVATRIPCDSKNKAPDYCLQYFTGSTGMVKSFDWGGQQQSNQQYTACVKPSSSGQSIMWKTCTTTGPNPFNIIGPNPLPTLTGEACTTDWVQPKGCPKQCEGFAPTTSEWKPYELLVNFDKMEVPPPPPSFSPPVNASNCMAECMAYESTMAPAYSCGCTPAMGANQTCVCLMYVPGAGGAGNTAPGPVNVDFDNVGFCLEYTQL